jgi:hypothetical protein
MNRGAKTGVFLLALVMASATTGFAQGQRGGGGRGRPALPSTTTLRDISWLSGNWRSAQGGLIIEERWTVPAGGAMLGVSRTLKGNQMVAFEFLRIVERDDKLVYIAQPNGRPPVEFTLTGMLENSVVFENPMHDFPKMITYTWRDDGSLQAVVSDGAANQQTFEFNRAP